jgi:hypothetical protein
MVDGASADVSQSRTRFACGWEMQPLSNEPVSVDCRFFKDPKYEVPSAADA